MAQGVEWREMHVEILATTRQSEKAVVGQR
jgi:hypothetical protein